MKWANSRSRSVLLLAAIPLVLGLISACDDDDGDENSNGASFDAQEVVSNAADTLEATESFHFVLSHENGGTAIIQDMIMTGAEGNVVRPDSLQAELQAETMGQQLNLQMVGIDDRTWLTNPFNPEQWQQMPDVRAQDILNLQAVPEVMRQVENPEAVGSESIAGVDSYRARATLDSGALEPVVPEAAESGQEVTMEIWIGQEDSLVRQIVITGPLNPDEPEDIVRTLELSEFDEPVTIEPPV